MPCCCPPCTTTEPISSLTRKFLAAARLPDIACELPLFASCASGSGASAASTHSRPTNCGERFKMNYLSFSNLVQAICLINLWQLCQHGPRLRFDVLALILRRQSHQHAANAAVGLD